MTKERERLLFDSNRAIAATGGDTRDLAADGPYHYSSDTYEEETLPLIDAGIDDPKDDPSGNDQDPSLVAPTNPSDDIFDSMNDGVHAPVDIEEKEDELATTVLVEEKDYAATVLITQSQEDMTNSITAAQSDTENGPFGLPIYAWGLIGVAGIALVVIGALIVKRRRRKSKTERSESSTDQRTKRRVAIDYGGDGDVDVEELSVVSNISSLSGGTFNVRQDRV